jgi:hypothetical protein
LHSALLLYPEHVNSPEICVGDSAVMMEVDHEKEEVYTDEMRTLSPADLQFMHPSDDAVSARLTTPVVTTYVDTDKISFERYMQYFVKCKWFFDYTHRVKPLEHTHKEHISVLLSWNT